MQYIFNTKLKSIVDSNDSLVLFRQSPPQFITSDAKKLLIKSTISNILQRVSNKIVRLRKYKKCYGK